MTQPRETTHVVANGSTSVSDNRPSVVLHLGDCLDVLRTLPDASVDCVITDPPYAEIDRPYGRLTEAEWWALIVEGVVPQVRRILKPTGSAVFILQPNYETPGKIRPWLWDFMAWGARQWGMVQDAYWLNISALPTAGCQRRYGLMRSAIKPCVWLGLPNCYRDQDAVLWAEADQQKVARMTGRYKAGREAAPSGKTNDRLSMCRAAEERGGTTPFNILPISTRDAEFGQRSHAAPTPRGLASWWTRYICPPDGIVCDPFMGSGTMGLAAIERGCSFIGIEKMPAYHAIARKRIDEALSRYPLLDSHRA